MIKAVLFDFNGTLFNDTHFHVAAWKNFCEKYCGLHYTEEEVCDQFIGPSNAMTLRRLFGEDITDDEIERWSAKKEEEYREMVRSDPKNMLLMEGATEFLDYLAEKNIPFALATASMTPNVEFYMEEIGMKRWFTMDRVVYDEGILPNKPDPAFYLEAARRLNMNTEDCLVFEDTRSGIQAAINANAGRIIAIDRTTPIEMLKNYPEIHEIIHDFSGFHRFLA